MFFATRFTTLCNLISRVFGVCSEKQMINVDARRIVASMADEHSSRDRSVCKFVSDTMSLNVPAVSGRADYSIPASADGANPEYAAGLALRSNAGLESFKKRNLASFVVALAGAITTRSYTKGGRRCVKQERSLARLADSRDKISAHAGPPVKAQCVGGSGAFHRVTAPAILPDRWRVLN